MRHCNFFPLAKEKECYSSKDFFFWQIGKLHHNLCFIAKRNETRHVAFLYWQNVLLHKFFSNGKKEMSHCEFFSTGKKEC